MFNAAPARWSGSPGGGGRSRAVCCLRLHSRRRSRFSCAVTAGDPTSMPMMNTTIVDPAATDWTITDPVIRFRVHGSERVFDLASADRWVLGSSPECSLQLDDPSGRISRRHAVASREGEMWTLADLGSTNGLRFNGEERRSLQNSADSR